MLAVAGCFDFVPSMKALSAVEMREVDRLTTERLGLSGLQLMENAGASVSEYLLNTLGDQACRHALVLCGKGNNGGDGFVCARHLQERGLKPLVCLFANPKTLEGDAAENFRRLKESAAEIRVVQDEADWNALQREVVISRVIIDALLGTGIKGKVEGFLASVINDVNEVSRDNSAAHPKMVLSVDMPSGLPSDGEPAAGPVIRARVTITFTAPKIGQLVSKDASNCGRLLVRQIGSPRTLVEEVGKSKVRWIEPEEFRHMPLVRRADSNKGNFGHVLLVAGSRGKTGAAILAGRGVLRAGAGLLTIAVPETEQRIVAVAQPEWMTEGLTSTEAGSVSLTNVQSGRFISISKGKTVLAIGPGMSTAEETTQFVRLVVRLSEQAIILDADGLNAFEGRAYELRERKSQFLAITPHPGEMARLCGLKTEQVQAERLRLASQMAHEWNAHVVLKGFHTIVATPDGHIYVNTTGNPGLAKGGSGDVLAGMIAGMVAQFGAQDRVQAVALAVYLHGLAADDATRERAEATLLANEITEQLPITFHRFLQEMQ